jgi:hypothetical protein
MSGQAEKSMRSPKQIEYDMVVSLMIQEDHLGMARGTLSGERGKAIGTVPAPTPPVAERAPPQPDPDRPAPDVTPEECVGWSHVYWHRNAAHRFAQAGTRWVAECRYKSNPTWDTTGWTSPDDLKASAAINPDLADGFVVIKEPSQPDKLTRTEFLGLLMACEEKLRERNRTIYGNHIDESVGMALTTEEQMFGSQRLVEALKGRRP